MIFLDALSATVELYLTFSKLFHEERKRVQQKN